MKIANKSTCNTFKKVNLSDLLTGNVYLGRLEKDKSRWHFLKTDEGSVIRLGSGTMFGPGTKADYVNWLYECEYIPEAILDW